MLVPKGQVVHQAGEQACLEGAEQESHSGDAGKVVCRGREDCHGAPAEHEEGEPSTGSQLLEEDVAGDLEDGVRDEEDHERVYKLLVRHFGLVLHVVVGGQVEDHGVADVCSVEEGEEVDGGRERDDAQVLLPEQVALEGAHMYIVVDGEFLREHR